VLYPATALVRLYFDNEGPPTAPPMKIWNPARAPGEELEEAEEETMNAE
jgi:hypothetical protein